MEKWANKLTVQNLKWNVSKQVYPVLLVLSGCYLMLSACSEDEGEWNGSNAGEGNGFNATELQLSVQRASITCT